MISTRQREDGTKKTVSFGSVETCEFDPTNTSHPKDQGLRTTIVAVDSFERSRRQRRPSGKKVKHWNLNKTALHRESRKLRELQSDLTGKPLPNLSLDEVNATIVQALKTLEAILGSNESRSEPWPTEEKTSKTISKPILIPSEGGSLAMLAKSGLVRSESPPRLVRRRASIIVAEAA